MTLALSSLPTWALSSAAGRSHQILQKRLAHAGFTGYEYRCLSVLAAAERLSQVELGAAAALDPRDVTHTVRGLEDRELVARTRDPRHGRRQLVALTPHGTQAAARLAVVMGEIQTAVFGPLNKRELTTLLHLLDRLGRD